MKDANVRREDRARSQDAYETMKVAVTQRIERAKADDEALKRSILQATTSAKAAHLRSTARSASRRPNETTQMSVSV